jgi:hypothetical protein
MNTGRILSNKFNDNLFLGGVIRRVQTDNVPRSAVKHGQIYENMNALPITWEWLRRKFVKQDSCCYCSTVKVEFNFILSQSSS